MIDAVTTADEAALEDSLTILAEAHKQMLATTSYDQQLKGFLGRCNRRGSTYRVGFHPLPTLTQLAKYCGCSVPTIFRLTTGETASVKVRTLTIINAIACICPAASYENLASEQRDRIADADRWVSSDTSTRGDIMDAITGGIARRQQSKWN